MRQNTEVRVRFNMSVEKLIRHYQRSVEKSTHDAVRMLHCVTKLYHLPITVQHLEDTLVGRTINGLRKFEGQCGEAAKACVAKWKAMVAAEESSDPETENVDASTAPRPLNDRCVGAGFYPEELHSPPIGLEAWDDMRVRYKYYRQRGNLRDLTLDDYMRWEEWWYKYQEWLEAQRWHER